MPGAAAIAGRGAGVISHAGLVTATYPTATYYALRNDGRIEYNDTGTPVTSQRWVTNTAAGNYNVRCTVLSGSLVSGPTGTFDALATTRTWTRGGASTTIRLELQDAYTLGTVKTVDVTLS